MSSCAFWIQSVGSSYGEAGERSDNSATDSCGCQSDRLCDIAVGKDDVHDHGARKADWGGAARMAVVITGGASGIGAATARLFASRGARVSILDRDAASLAVVVDEIRAAGGAVDGHVINVTDAEAVQETVERAARDGGGLEAMHVNAGIEFAASALETSAADWRRVIDVNLNGAFFAAHAALVEMQRGAGGVIVFTSSTLAERGAAETAAYSAAKAGILGLM